MVWYTTGMEVVGAVIKNQSDEYLLQQRDENAPTFKHYWTLFGGRVEEGEKPAEALLRELDEELALTPRNILSFELTQTNTDRVGIVQYIYEIATDVQLDQLTLSEGEAMQYVPEATLFDRKFAFNIQEVLARSIKQNR